MSDLSSITLKVGMTAVAWTEVSDLDVSELKEDFIRVEITVSVLAIDEDSVTLAIEQQANTEDE